MQLNCLLVIVVLALVGCDLASQSSATSRASQEKQQLERQLDSARFELQLRQELVTDIKSHASAGQDLYKMELMEEEKVVDLKVKVHDYEKQLGITVIGSSDARDGKLEVGGTIGGHKILSIEKVPAKPRTWEEFKKKWESSKENESKK
jgi:hypothetical protein